MVKNITLSAEEKLIQLARERARRNKTTLNSLFREWLARYAGHGRAHEDYAELMERLAYVEPGARFSRDEMNER